jgi:hypothetical protein
MSDGSPSKCPDCGCSVLRMRDDITYHDYFEDGTMRVRCCDPDCGAAWYEVWQFVEYVMEEGDDNRAHLRLTPEEEKEREENE